MNHEKFSFNLFFNVIYKFNFKVLNIISKVFGELEKAIVITDERGRATGDAIIEYCKKPCASLALRKCQEGCFFVTAYV